MAQFGMLINPQTLLAIATVTTTGTSGNLTLAPGAGYRFFLKVKTVSGTSPTLDVFLSTSYDATAAAGTDYETFLHFAQVTTSGLGRQMSFRPYLSAGDVALESQSAFFGTGGADGATGSTAIAVNGPINNSAIKVRWVAGGTSPSFAFEIGVISVSQDLSD
jgi:hypothetical protein